MSYIHLMTVKNWLGKKKEKIKELAGIATSLLKGTNQEMTNFFQLLRVQTKPLTPGLHRTLQTQTVAGRETAPHGPTMVGTCDYTSIHPKHRVYSTGGEPRWKPWTPGDPIVPVVGSPSVTNEPVF